MFRRQALYGYDVPVKKKGTKKACNCLPRLCCCCCGYSINKNMKGESKENKKIKIRSKEALTEKHAPENIEEGIKGIENEKSSLMPRIDLEKKFGQSPVFIASMLREDGGLPTRAVSALLLKEALHVISSSYEDKTKWGKEKM